MADLRKSLIKLAHDNPELRKDILPLLKEGADKFPAKKVTKQDIEKDPDRVEKEVRKSLSTLKREFKGNPDAKAFADKLKGQVEDARTQMAHDPQFAAKMITKVYKELNTKAKSFAKKGADKTADNATRRYYEQRTPEEIGMSIGPQFDEIARQVNTWADSFDQSVEGLLIMSRKGGGVGKMMHRANAAAKSFQRGVDIWKRKI
jgi:hypothetical protein